jgi:dipeptidyl aminopeptidase/acylaminoacyl peptidase
LVKQVVSETATYPSLNTGGDFRYYNANDGKFYRVLPNGAIQNLSDQVFYNAQKVTWAKNKNTAVIEYPDNSKIVYNFDTNKQVTLPKHWQDFSFSSDGGEIAAKSIGMDPSNRWLVTINSDGTGSKLIEPMGENADKVTVDWSPSKQVVAFSQTGAPQGGERREILFVGLNGENFKSTVVEGSGFQPQWSTTGKKLLYSVYSSRSDFKPELWLVDSYGDSIGNNRHLLSLNTWADKCTFSNDDTAFCAVPKDLPTGAGMARDIAAYNYDDLYKIDLKTGLKTPIPLNDNYNVTNISYDAGSNKIMFTDLNRTGVFESQL